MPMCARACICIKRRAKVNKQRRWRGRGQEIGVCREDGTLLRGYETGLCVMAGGRAAREGRGVSRRADGRDGGRRETKTTRLLPAGTRRYKYLRAPIDKTRAGGEGEGWGRAVCSPERLGEGRIYCCVCHCHRGCLKVRGGGSRSTPFGSEISLVCCASDRRRVMALVLP